MLQRNITSGTCENTGSWNGGLPSCVPLNCSQDNLPVPANAIVQQLSSCGLAYQSQCTVSCDEGFTGDNITYLCNITSDLTMVDWMVINGTEIKHYCTRGLLLSLIHNIYVLFSQMCVSIILAGMHTISQN